MTIFFVFIEIRDRVHKSAVSETALVELYFQVRFGKNLVYQNVSFAMFIEDGLINKKLVSSEMTVAFEFHGLKQFCHILISAVEEAADSHSALSAVSAPLDQYQRHWRDPPDSQLCL